MKLPSTKRSWLSRCKWAFEAVSAVSIVAGGIIGTLKVHEQIRAADLTLQMADRGPADYSGMAWILGGVALSLLAQVGKIFIAYDDGRRAAVLETPMDLWGCCLTLRTMLISADGEQADDSLRITIYKVCKGKKGERHLEQLVHYASDPEHKPAGGAPGRRFSEQCGVIGQASRTGKPMTVHRDTEDDEAYRTAMIKDLGFSVDQARGLDLSRWSCMAVPLLDIRQGVAGVVYFDCKSREYFTDKRKSLMLAGCSAIKTFAKERYK